VTLSRAQLEELAGLMVEKLETRRRREEPLVGVLEVAQWACMSRPWVYRNAAQLGGFRLGPGPRAPWRFRLSEVAAQFDPLWGGWM